MTSANGIDLRTVKHEDILTGEELVRLLEAADAGDLGPLDDHDRKVVSDIRAVLDDIKSDEITLIADSYFAEYARDLAEDIGAIPPEYTWPTSHIDWEAATDELKMDYAEYAIDGVTFWVSWS